VVRVHPDPPLSRVEILRDGIKKQKDKLRRIFNGWRKEVKRTAEHTGVCEQRSSIAKLALKRRVRGAIAQLGEHLLCKQRVVGSIPTSSTKYIEYKY
jgi:hypothetical protein